MSIRSELILSTEYAAVVTLGYFGFIEHECIIREILLWYLLISSIGTIAACTMRESRAMMIKIGSALPVDFRTAIDIVIGIFLIWAGSWIIGLLYLVHIIAYRDVYK